MYNSTQDIPENNDSKLQNLQVRTNNTTQFTATATMRSGKKMKMNLSSLQGNPRKKGTG
jgi:hypothetical protein